MAKTPHISRYVIAYKFFLGLIETLLGVGIIFFGNRLFEFYINFRNNDWLEEPHDLIARLIENVIPYLFDHRGFLVFILLLLGLTKTIGAIGMWYHKSWGLDILTFVTILLLPFEVVVLIFHPSAWKIFFFVINIFIALYFVNFDPLGYLTSLKKRISI